LLGGNFEIDELLSKCAVEAPIAPNVCGYSLNVMQQQLTAWIFLLVVAAATIIYCVRWCYRTPYAPRESLILFVTLLLTRVLWRARVPPLPLGPGQGGVLVSNHRSSIDPFFIQIVAGRYVHWMVAREYCEHPAFGWFLRMTRAIPTGRGGIDTAATKAAIRLASQGELVGMFPEGRINVTDQLMLPGRPGALLVALKACVPVVPCYIEGSPYGGTAWSPFFMRARVTVRFGEPIDLTEFYGREGESGVIGALLMEVMSEIARLAGRSDFQPCLAGRKWKPTSEELEIPAKTSRE
jgi:1-acyl-sn-glycerol-3-phosphate acyltransferase